VTVVFPRGARPGGVLDADLRNSVVSRPLLEGISARCGEVDGNAGFDTRGLLGELAADGALDLGLPGSSGTYTDQARVLAELAGVCMTSAFSAWAHRMTTEYLVVFGGDHLAGLADEVRRAVRPGSTALAGTFRAAAGVADMPVRVDAQGASGFISWASNLYDNTVVVTGAAFATEHRLIAFDLAADGVELQAVNGLLALDATHSGAIRLNDVPVSIRRVLESPFAGFIAAVRPTFLILQSAFALGLASASLDAIGEPQGLAQALVPQVDAARGDLATLVATLDGATAQLDRGERPVLRSMLQLRLDAAHLATRATQLELAVRGGAGYSALSATARRVREALFLPVQSPTEVQLQWELQQTA